MVSLIYIFGAGHCGSTLLDMLLGSHSQIIGTGELSSLASRIEDNQRNICSCGRSVYNCSFWNKVFTKAEIFNRSNIESFYKLPIYNNRTNFILRKSSLKEQEFIAVNEDLYQSISDCSGKLFIVDSSEDPCRPEILLKSQNIKIFFVHLIRDGRAVMWSFRRKQVKPLSAIGRWLADNLKIELVKLRNSGMKCLTIYYQDLALQPELCLRRILEMVDLDYEKGMLNFSQVEHHQPNGNRMRFQKDSRIQEDLSWKENLSIKDRIMFYLLAGWLNKIYRFRARRASRALNIY